ncbi:cytochrome bc complex cytochrome b subunit [Undibacterium sp. RTI2.1]|uniref:cytochrome b n=1 Tax=unclassified Undibacterium TaxID=2630295 RepID=UPI002AB51F1D|nr:MULTISPECIES: cytochrome bc complex cytochrome b subunit [unclassified Undibacterium]MDY7540203.1 cytochrome bc complex cytochrome b subunit [Undibacterium sp. 5I1]MEB0030377.1 cytochrome bc complex cytochrome b subunit [Undibacterium sp. RTI2.1]MEB0115342.1 cytochrome bc complex cytochrome b subunit [Undibacterium sp. RTI2.2]MEB0232528.1 cytochrome bc complex cytochrome b subunit [Undibacterium sp. 10I3]MEB0257130.1 cytochrome bc complex cytochrome b subunit [Undibacterium sp. 5I1]
MMAFVEKKLPADAPIAAKALNWVDSRFPLTKLWNDQWGQYYAPKNFNFWYIFGSLAMLVLVIQIVTGIFLVMHYKPDANLAFASVEYIMREVPAGWFVRYAHSTGASAFFIIIYLHMTRALMYGSYRKPRELIWLFGFAIFLCLMAEAFFGYLLPWGQMSYWGAQVIVNLFGAIPFIGPDLSLWIRGDYVVSDATLNRFFSFHVIAIPLVLLGLVAAHLIALHEVGSNNPDGIEIKDNIGADGHPVDGIPSHPYYTFHDIFGVTVFLTIFSAVIFFAPEMGGYFLEYNNFIPADSLKTPSHIAPTWYFTPFYSILRATTSEFLYVVQAGVVAYVALIFLTTRLPQLIKIAIAAVGLLAIIGMMPFGLDAKFWGVVLFGGSVMILGGLPWLDLSPVKSIRYRPEWHKYVYIVFGIAFVALGYLGVQPPSPTFERISQVCAVLYFSFFLLMPWWSTMGTFKTPPKRVTFAAH